MCQVRGQSDGGGDLAPDKEKSGPAHGCDSAHQAAGLEDSGKGRESLAGSDPSPGPAFLPAVRTEPVKGLLARVELERRALPRAEPLSRVQPRFPHQQNLPLQAGKAFLKASVLATTRLSTVG